ncbi:hypothetical protein BaRGS_00006602 [Batillaria attramentaria]|uniref:EF-hand domain-containing protein n=1 Tax=Batillaria attramentaria TaxID=370345 RepID=A0ABD0LRY3_9CAEN|nr:hypothetical protein BaRGS_008985 [Batillaria attramentaria]
MDCRDVNAKLAQICSQRLAKERDPIERFKCLALKNGAAGIKTLGRKFRIMDYNGYRQPDWEEFYVGCRECRMTRMSREELREVFDCFYRDDSGTLDSEEFLAAIRPPMSKIRKQLVQKAFAKMDRTGDEVITIDDMIAVYDVTRHPKFKNGEMTEKQVLREFLKNFEAEDHIGGRVTLDEWMDYYAGVSASVDDDAYFSLMMYNCWGVKACD